MTYFLNFPRSLLSFLFFFPKKQILFLEICQIVMKFNFVNIFFLLFVQNFNLSCEQKKEKKKVFHRRRHAAEGIFCRSNLMGKYWNNNLRIAAKNKIETISNLSQMFDLEFKWVPIHVSCDGSENVYPIWTHRKSNGNPQMKCSSAFCCSSVSVHLTNEDHSKRDSQKRKLSLDIRYVPDSSFSLSLVWF